MFELSSESEKTRDFEIPKVEEPSSPAASPFRGKVEKKGGEFGVRSAAKTSCSGVFGPTSALPSPVRSQALPRAKEIRISSSQNWAKLRAIQPSSRPLATNDAVAMAVQATCEAAP